MWEAGRAFGGGSSSAGMKVRCRMPRAGSHKLRKKLGPGAHTYNSSYMGGRDREDCSSRPTLAKNVIENPSQQTSRDGGSLL
jgi:hypothetical protein